MRHTLLLALALLLAPGCASSEPAPSSPELRKGDELKDVFDEFETMIEKLREVYGA